MQCYLQTKISQHESADATHNHRTKNTCKLARQCLAVKKCAHCGQPHELCRYNTLRGAVPNLPAAAQKVFVIAMLIRYKTLCQTCRNSANLRVIPLRQPQHKVFLEKFVPPDGLLWRELETQYDVECQVEASASTSVLHPGAHRFRKHSSRSQFCY